MPTRLTRSPATRSPWSLQQRAFLLIALVSGIAVAVPSVAGVLYLTRSIHAQLHSLTTEELEETRSAILQRGLASMPTITDELASEHPDVALAWCLTDSDSTATPRWFGAHALFDTPPPAVKPTPHEGLQHLGGARYAISATLRSDETLTIVLDGTSRLSRVSTYWSVAGGAIVLSLALGILAARLLCSRLKRDLASLPDELRNDPTTTPASVPIELAAVSSELSTMLQAALKQAEQTRFFVASLAHELRSPLQNLIGEAEVTMLRGRTVDNYKSLLDRQVRRLHEFALAVDNTLALCTTDRPVSATGWEEFQIDDELAVRLHTEQSLAASKRIELSFTASGNLTIRADREALVRAVRNLINNAIKWSPPGGAVLVDTLGTDDCLTLTVHDSGPGIPAAERERILAPFCRGQVPEGDRAGFGLGLAIVAATARQHSGRLLIGESHLGGAKVELTIRRFASSPPQGEL